MNGMSDIYKEIDRLETILEEVNSILIEMVKRYDKIRMMNDESIRDDVIERARNFINIKQNQKEMSLEMQIASRIVAAMHAKVSAVSDEDISRAVIAARKLIERSNQ